MTDPVNQSEEIARPVGAPGRVQSVSVDSVAAELTQALRRLQRAIWSARVEAGLKAGKPVGATPLVHELEKQYFQLENVRVAYGLRDEECSV